MVEVLKYKNLAYVNLFASVTTVGQSTVIVQSGGGSKFDYPSYLVLEELDGVGGNVTKREIVKCTLVSGDVISITRGQGGTVASTFSISNHARISQYIVAEDFNNLLLRLLDCVLKSGDQTISGIKNFNNNLYSNAQTLLGGGAEVMGLLRMGSGFLFGMGVIPGGALAIHRHPYGAHIAFGTRDGTTFNEQFKIGSGSDVKMGGLDIKPIASSGERAAGIATDRVPTVAQVKSGISGLRKILQTTRAINAASGAQNIAHGLGVIPKYILVHAVHDRAEGTQNNTFSVARCDGFSDFTVNGCTYQGHQGFNGTWMKGFDGNASNVIYIINSNSAVSGHYQFQYANITADATNITINWTYSPSGSSSLTNNIYVTMMVIG